MNHMRLGTGRRSLLLRLRLILVFVTGLAGALAVAGGTGPDGGTGGESPAPASRPQMIRGRVVDAAGRPLAGALVRLEGPAAPRPAARPVDATVDQHGHRFDPAVVAVPAGGAVRFRNSDPEVHSVHAQGAADFNFSVPPGGEERVLLQEPGEVTLRCDFHPEMGARIRVFATPWFAVTGGEGLFRIDGVPAGPAAVVAEWGGGEVHVPISVGADDASEMLLRLPNTADRPRPGLARSRIPLDAVEKRIRNLLAMARDRAAAGDADGARRLLEQADLGTYRALGLHAAVRVSVSGRAAEALRMRLESLRSGVGDPKGERLAERVREAEAAVTEAVQALRVRGRTELESYEVITAPEGAPPPPKGAQR